MVTMYDALYIGGPADGRTILISAEHFVPYIDHRIGTGEWHRYEPDATMPPNFRWVGPTPASALADMRD